MRQVRYLSARSDRMLDEILKRDARRERRRLWRRWRPYVLVLLLCVLVIGLWWLTRAR